jgi:hypothetical protein
MSKGLIDKLIQASSIINNKSIKGSGNYIVVSQVIADAINNIKRVYRMKKIKRIFNEEV